MTNNFIIYFMVGFIFNYLLYNFTNIIFNNPNLTIKLKAWIDKIFILIFILLLYFTIFATVIHLDDNIISFFADSVKINIRGEVLNDLVVLYYWVVVLVLSLLEVK